MEAAVRWRGLVTLSVVAWIGALGVPQGGCASSSNFAAGGTGGHGTGSYGGYGGGGAGGAGGVGGHGGGGTSTGTGSLASACAHAGDCEPGLSCLTSTGNDPVFGGGLAGGLCTRACNTDTDCPQPDGICYQIDPNEAGRCTLACAFGPALDGYFDALDPLKCLGREDLRCVKQTGATSATAGLCLPTCGEDAECDGLFCDPRTSVCVAQPGAGAPFGAACDPTATNPCAGRCVGFDSAVGLCSMACVLGGAGLDAHDCGGPEKGLCAFHPANAGPGDGGWCTPSCQLQSDCASPDFFCRSVAGLTETLNLGYCFGAKPCPLGSECGADDGQCTLTTAGAYCLDPRFPLGALAPDGGAPDAGY
jgi:hypothetical protein